MKNFKKNQISKNELRGIKGGARCRGCIDKATCEAGGGTYTWVTDEDGTIQGVHCVH